MNVLHIYYEPQPAGQSRHVLSLVPGLAAAGYRQSVVLPASLTSAVTALRAAGALVYPLPLRKIGWPPAARAALRDLIRKENFDIVHVHSQEAGLVARGLARLAGARRLVYTPQTIDIRRRRWHWLYRLSEVALARLTDRIVSVCEVDRRRLISWGIPAGRVVTIPNGVELPPAPVDEAVAGWRRALGVERDAPLVMQVGRLSAQKDPLGFVAGAALGAAICPAARWVMLGDGPLRAAVAARIGELGLGERVRLAGWRPQAARWMAAADVLTLTSRWEGVPYAVLEAMAAGRPVVAPAVNGCSEIVQDGLTGFLVAPADPAAWARRVCELLAEPERAAALGRAGRERVAALFRCAG